MWSLRSSDHLWQLKDSNRDKRQTYCGKEVIGMWRVRIPLNRTNHPSTLSCYPPYYILWWVQIDDGNVVLSTVIHHYILSYSSAHATVLLICKESSFSFSSSSFFICVQISVIHKALYVKNVVYHWTTCKLYVTLQLLQGILKFICHRKQYHNVQPTKCHIYEVKLCTKLFFFC